MNLIELIEKYIVYLITECGLSVTVHPLEEETLITFSRLMRFNIHDNSYCTYIKSTPEGHARCLAQQKRVLEKCKSEKESFCGICHAGVFEHVYPIYNGKTIIGFISIGGYADENGKSRCVRTAERLGYSKEALSRHYAALPPPDRNKERLDTLVLPLCSMLELAYKNQIDQPKEDTLVTKVCRYVKQNYAFDLTTEDICKEFFCSRSHFSHMFKKTMSKSFSEYLTEVRLDHAKRLLKYSNLRITEISFSVGFNDANYFSNVFKKKMGISPGAYRKASR